MAASNADVELGGAVSKSSLFFSSEVIRPASVDDADGMMAFVPELEISSNCVPVLWAIDRLVWPSTPPVTRNDDMAILLKKLVAVCSWALVASCNVTTTTRTRTLSLAVKSYLVLRFPT